MEGEHLPETTKFHFDTIEYPYLFETPEIHDCFFETYRKADDLKGYLNHLKTEGRYDDEARKRVKELRFWFGMEAMRARSLFNEVLSIKLLR